MNNHVEPLKLQAFVNDKAELTPQEHDHVFQCEACLKIFRSILTSAPENQSPDD